MTTIQINDQELATILAALRYWQQEGLADNPALRSLELHNIAAPDNVLCSLDGNGVDELCERLNCSDGPSGEPVLFTAAELHRELLDLQHGDEETVISALDEMVHDAQIGNASEVNNQGPEAQITALLQAGVLADTIKAAVREW